MVEVSPGGKSAELDPNPNLKKKVYRKKQGYSIAVRTPNTDCKTRSHSHANSRK
jgi:hypothetical protein